LKSTRRMIIANMINRIEIGADYDIHIDFTSLARCISTSPPR